MGRLKGNLLFQNQLAKTLYQQTHTTHILSNSYLIIRNYFVNSSDESGEETNPPLESWNVDSMDGGVGTCSDI